MRSPFSLKNTQTLIAGVAFASLAACGGGDDKSSGEQAKNSSSSSASLASVDPAAPVLNVGQVVNASGGDLDSIATRETRVPGLNGSALGVNTTEPTEGTMASVLSDDGKARTAPQDGRLVGISLTSRDVGLSTSNSSGSGTLDSGDTPYTIELDAGGKKTQLAQMKSSDLFAGKKLLVSIPKDGDAKLVLTADGGKQIVNLSDGKRDDAASAGVPVASVVTVPVASTKTCEDDPGQKATLPENVKLDGPVSCNVTWALADHVSGAGWAPKDRVFLVAQVIPRVPSATYKKGDGIFDSQTYSSTEHVTLTGSLGSQALKVLPNDQTGGPIFALAPIAKDTKPNKMTLKVIASNTTPLASDGFPTKVKMTLPTMLSGMDSTTTLTLNSAS